MSNIIDSLFFELGITGDFERQVNDALKNLNDFDTGVKNTEKTADNLGKSAKQVGGIFSQLAQLFSKGAGFDAIAKDASIANDELKALAKNLGLNAEKLAAWEHSANLNNGSGKSAINFIKNLSNNLMRDATEGNKTVLNMLSELNGQSDEKIDIFNDDHTVKKADDILLEMADRFSKMDRNKAYSIASKMGMDDGLFNTLAEGKESAASKLNIAGLDLEQKKRSELEKLKQQGEKQSQKNVKVAKDLLEAVTKFTKVLGALGTMVMAGVGFERLIEDMANFSKELDNTSKNIGVTSTALTNWRGAAALAGGSAEGMTSFLGQLQNSFNRLAIMGDTSLVPVFNAFGVGVLDANGKVRDLNDVLLDLSASMSKMDRVQAHTLAQSLGMDDGTFNLLIQGPEKVNAYLTKVSGLYKSTEQDLATSQKLTESISYIDEQFNALKLMIANAVTPVLVKMADYVTEFLDYLQRHEGLVKGVFYGFATVLSAVLIPTLISAAGAAVAFIAPFLPAIAVILGVAAAIGLLYDDYVTWANGGESLFNWDVFTKWIKTANLSIDNLKSAISFLITGYKNWGKALQAGKDWLELKGFTKNGEMSISSLATGFSNLAKDLWNTLLPAIKAVSGAVSKMLDGDFSGAWEDLKNLSVSAFNGATDLLKETAKGATDRLTGYWDVLTGHDPETDKDSLTQNKENLLNNSTLNGQTEILARAVSHGEGNYNSVNRGLVNGKNLGAYEEDLSQITINEILARNALPESDPRRMNAVGRYQIINKTLKGLVKQLNLTGDELFTPELQDKLFLALLPKSAKAYVSGKSDNKVQALTDMAKVWASIGVPVAMQGKHRFVQAGESYYAGDGGNKSNKQSLSLVTAALDGARNSQTGLGQISKEYNISNNTDNSQYVTNNDGDTQNSTVINQQEKTIEVAKRQESDAVLLSKGINTLINLANKPFVGEEIAKAANKAQPHIAAMTNLSRGQNVVNNNQTEVAINGNIVVNSSSPTISGTMGDAMEGVSRRIVVLNRNNYGLS